MMGLRWHWHVPGMAPVLSSPTHPMLSPKAVAVANNLACRGLDHLEEKIPALHYPVDKVGHRSVWDSPALC